MAMKEIGQLLLPEDQELVEHDHRVALMSPLRLVKETIKFIGELTHPLVMHLKRTSSSLFQH